MLFYGLPCLFFCCFYGNPATPKLKNSSQLMVPPVLQGLISLFPPLNSVSLCVVWQWLVQQAVPAWHILKLTHELTWEGFACSKLGNGRSGLLPALRACFYKWYLSRDSMKDASVSRQNKSLKWSSRFKIRCQCNGWTVRDQSNKGR